MKKKIYIPLFVLLLSFNMSCDDGFLDTTPYHALSTAMIFTTDEYATLAVNGAYNALAQNAFDHNFYVYATSLGPEAFCHPGQAPLGSSFSQGTGTDRDARIVNVYRNMYRPIIYANDIIAGLEGNDMVSADLREKFIGEAKFLRGLCYFYLYNLYGGVVILDKPTPPSETYLPRNSREEVVALIINDFADAAARLPEANGTRATKGAAIAMLGKVYLYNQQWPQAATEFAKLLGSPYNYELVDNFGDNFDWKTQNNVESVFEIQYAMAGVGTGSTFNDYFGNRVTGSGSGGGDIAMSQRAFHVYTYADGSYMDFSTMPQRNGYATEKEYGVDLTAWYEENLEDVDIRLHQSSILPGATYLAFNLQEHKLLHPTVEYQNVLPYPAVYGNWAADAYIFLRKFVTVGNENQFGKDDCPTNFPLIRFADVLLMYAEALNEANGATTEVYAAVDRVRARAGLTGLGQLKPGMSKDEMRREIWLERFRELMFESILYFDVKRWNVAHTNDPVFGLNNDEWDYRYITKFYTKKFTATRDYLWPIPGQEIDTNPLITQNPGWD